jgi:putative transposase
MTKQNHWISSYGCVHNVNYHFVWSTKYRRRVLVGDVSERLKELNKSISVDKGFDIVVQ